jgi:hypothetical protein
MCNNNGNCIAEILERIIMLQQQNNSATQLGCERPMLTNTTLANTRPINLYCCCTNSIWTMPYDYNDVTGTSSVFRVENVNDNTATLRILIDNGDTYTATDNFFTIDLDYISCIKCLTDTLITNI